MLHIVELLFLYQIMMNSRPPLPEGLEVYVQSYDPQGKATYISGYFEFMKTRLNFNVIMMDEYGGPNVAATFPDETQAALRNLGLDNEALDELITSLQRKIMEGQAHIQIKPDPNDKKQ